MHQVYARLAFLSIFSLWYEQALSFFEARGVPIIRLEDQEKTDLEKTFAFAAEKYIFSPADTILVVGGYDSMLPHFFEGCLRCCYCYSIGFRTWIVRWVRQGPSVVVSTTPSPLLAFFIKYTRPGVRSRTLLQWSAGRWHIVVYRFAGAYRLLLLRRN